MRLSDETIAVLKNFNSICSQLLIKPGNVIKTGNVPDTLVCRALVKETFDRQFGIYDIGRFLSVMSLFTEPELTFTDTQIKVHQGSQSVFYTYAAPSMVYYPETEPKIREHVTFSLTADILTNITKALSVLQQKELAIVGQDGKISIETMSVRNESSDRYKVEVGETDQTFSAIISLDNFKMMAKDYNVIQDLRGMTEFRNNEMNYFIGNELSSVFPKGV